MYRAFRPRLDLWRGTSAYLSSNFAAQVMPPPSPSIVQYGYFRGGGHPSEAAGLAAVGSFVFPTIGRLLVAPVALALLVFTGETNAALLLIGAVSLLVSVAVGLAGFWFLRREETARHLGAKLQRPLSSILVRLRREPVQDAEQRAVAIRERTLAVLRGGCRLGSIGVAANLLLTYVILLVALRSVDVSAHDLPAADAFAAFAVAFWAGAVIPITGSGLGVVDTVMIAALIELSDGPDDPLVAAVLIWRTFYSFLTLPLGAITLSRFRKANPDVLKFATSQTAPATTTARGN